MIIEMYRKLVNFHNYESRPCSMLVVLISILFYVIDVNECLEASSVCDQLCTNNIGSFTCSCNTGYQLSDSDYKTCFGKINCGIMYF